MSEAQKDPRIAAASAHWAHRMVTNGVPLADFQDVTGAIAHWDEWCAAWVTRADVHAALGEEAADQGAMLSAGEHWRRAAVCAHFGKFLFVHDMDQMKAAHGLSIALYQKAMAHFDPPAERIEIAFEGATLAGHLRKPKGVSKPPVVVMCMGLDSTKEEMFTNEQVFLDRGMATFAFDGPGQGEAEYDLPIFHDYERPVSAVFDALEGRGDIDGARMGLWGVSLGGYYAPRAAAFEKRIKACISLTGPFNFAEAFAKAPGLTRAAFSARVHAQSEKDAMEMAAKLDLGPVASQIECPLYIVGGALDRVIPEDHPQRLADAARSEVVMNMVSDGTHVVNNRPYKYRPQSADWMALKLRA